MPRGGAKPGERRGGRQKGSLNKRTHDIKARAAKFCGDGLRVLDAIAHDEKAPAAARVSAVNSLMDRAYGRPAQAHTGADGGPIAVTSTVIHEHHDG